MEITTSMIVGSLVNLALFFGLAFYLGKKPFVKGLETRSATIAATLKDAERQMAEMTAKLAEQKKELGDIQTQVATIVSNGQTLSKQLADDLVAGAKAEGERLRERAQREIDQELQLTRQKLRQDLGREAVAQAERLLAERLDAGKQSQLIRDFAQQVTGHQGDSN